MGGSWVETRRLGRNSLKIERAIVEAEGLGEDALKRLKQQSLRVY